MNIPWQPPTPFLECTQITSLAHCITIEFTTIIPSAPCPICHIHATRIHSTYRRTIQDLSVGVQAIQFHLGTRKWFCDNGNCIRKIFTERFEWLASYQRRTERLIQLLRKLAFTTSCVTTAKLAKFWQVPVSHYTLLLLIRCTSFSIPVLTMIGLDDFFLRKGNHYRILICDLQTRRPIAILPDCEGETVTCWLSTYSLTRQCYSARLATCAVHLFVYRCPTLV